MSISKPKTWFCEQERAFVPMVVVVAATYVLSGLVGIHVPVQMAKSSLKTTPRYAKVCKVFQSR